MSDKPAGGLSLRIGLMLSELQSDFLAAEQTVKQGIAALNRQQNIVKLKMVTDITGLDSVTDKTKILEVQEQSLTQLLEMQRDKLKLATAAYQESAQSKGVNATATKNLETAMERERLAVARLESQLKELSAQKISIDMTQLQDSISKINAKIQHVKLTAEIDTSKLKDAGSVFDTQKIHVAALTKELELQRQKLIQLREAMYQSAKTMGGDSVQTLNIKSNVLQQIQEISKLEAKLKELSNTNINLQVRSESLRQAEQTISDSIARINARIEHIKVKTEIDVSKLASATSEFDKARTHVQGLNRELELQNQKLAEMRKALSTSISVNGISNVKTISLSTDIQRQIQEIDKLKAKIQELNNIPPPKTNSLLSGYLNIKGDVTGKLQEITNAFSQLKDATSSVDSAITSTLGVIGTIPSPVGKAVAAFASLPIVFKGIENSILDMTKAAASAGDSVYVMSRGFQMSFADTAKFTTMCKVAGVEVNDLSSTIKMAQRQIVRGGEDSRGEQWLKRYGESAFDASGRLKDLNEMALALSRGLKKAQAEGNGMAFILSTMRTASADVITSLEDLEGNYELAATIVKNGLANPELAHAVQGNLNALNTQAAQMNATFESALLPVANEIIPKVTERMGKMTTLIRDNKDVILDFGRDFAQVWRSVEETVDKATEGFSYFAQLARDNRVVRQTTTDDIVKKYKDDANVRNAADLVEKEIAAGGYTDEDINKLRSRTDLYKKEIERATADISALYAKRREEFAEENKEILNRYVYDDTIKSASDLLKRLSADEQEAIKNADSTFGSLIERIRALYPEFKRLQEEAAETKKAIEESIKNPSSIADWSTFGQERQKFANNDKLVEEMRSYRKYIENADEILFKSKNNDYQNKLYDLQKWLQEQLPRDQEQPLEKYNAVMEEYKARSIQIEQERADKIAEIHKSVDAEFKTSLQNRLEKIEEEKQAWIKAGMQEAEAAELAQRRIAKAYEDAAAKAQQYIKDAADIEYSLTHTAFEKQLRDIEQWKDAQRQKAETAEEVAGIIKNAAAKEAEAFEREVDRIKGKIQTLEDKIFEQEHSQYENDLRKVQQERLNYYEDYQKSGMLNADTQAKIERWYNNAVGQLNKKVDESRKSGGDYTKSPEGTMQRGGNGILVLGGDQILDDGLKGLQANIGLMTDERNIRSQLMSKLDAETRAMVERIQSTRELTEAQRKMLQSAERAASSYQLIEGDKVADMPQPTMPEMPTSGYDMIVSDQIVSMFKPTEAELQQFDAAIKQTAEKLEELDPMKKVAEKQAEFEKYFPAEYLKNLADGAKAVSDTQSFLTKSTLELVDAQSKLRDALNNLPDIKLPNMKPTQEKLPTESLQQLSTLQNISEAQDLLARKPLERLEPSPQPQRQDQRQDNGWKFDFDWDVFGGVGTAAIAGLEYLTAIGRIAPHPAAKVMALGGTALLAAVKGSYDATTEPQEQPVARLQEMPNVEMPNVDLTAITTPLAAIDEKLQSVLTEMQSGYQDDRLQELLGTLPNIEANVSDILQAMQAKGEEEISFEMLTTPLASIDEKLQSVLTEIQSGKTTLENLLESQRSWKESLGSMNFLPESPQEQALPKIDNFWEEFPSGDFQHLTMTTQALTEAQEIYTRKLQELKEIPTRQGNENAYEFRAEKQEPVANFNPLSELDLSSITTPLALIDEKLQNVLTAMQDRTSLDGLQESLGSLPNIESSNSDILRELQAQAESEVKISFETVVTPLNNISSLVEKVLSALNDREPPQINVSPNIHNDLGGAYVFDDALKKSLVDDITNTVVTAIKEAVQQGTSRTSYGYSA